MISLHNHFGILGNRGNPPQNNPTFPLPTSQVEGKKMNTSYRGTPGLPVEPKRLLKAGELNHHGCPRWDNSQWIPSEWHAGPAPQEELGLESSTPGQAVLQ